MSLELELNASVTEEQTERGKEGIRDQLYMPDHINGGTQKSNSFFLYQFK
jgi:hypothetical protein